MTKRNADDMSPVQAGLVHSGMSLLAFTALGAVGAGVIHVSGDPRDASPRMQVALFETQAPVGDFGLKSRFAERDGQVVLTSAVVDRSQPLTSGAPSAAYYEDDSGDDPTARVIDVADAMSTGGMEQGSGPVSVKINGRVVQPGQSLGTLDPGRARDDGEEESSDEDVSLPRAPIREVSERTSAGNLPAISADGMTPARAYARPSDADPAKPRVALIVGGLGVNESVTLQAIRDLPPEVTLAFAPRSSNRNRGPQYYINLARAAGHEVLLEVPMEPYEWGRSSPEPNTLYSGASYAENIDNLYATLSIASGYFGVINYNGAKFATSEKDVTPIVSELRSRGIALIEDGSLPRSAFSAAADTQGLTFVRADGVIDGEIDASMIEAQLAKLESEALAKGYAIGTGYAFPVTVDTILIWQAQLEEKGIELVPASEIMFRITPPEEMAGETGKDRTANLPADGGKAG